MAKSTDERSRVKCEQIPSYTARFICTKWAMWAPRLLNMPIVDSINEKDPEDSIGKEQKDQKLTDYGGDKNQQQTSSTRELLKRVRVAAEEKFAFTQNKNNSAPISSRIVLKGSESPAWHGSITKTKLKQRPTTSSSTTRDRDIITTIKPMPTIKTIAQTPAATKCLYDYFVKVRGEYEDFREIEAVRLQRRLEKFSDFPRGSKTVHFEEFEKDVVPWQEDSSTRNCFLCLEDFSLLHRRHHCRLCGRIICSSCISSIPIKLLDASAKDLKSCTKCYKFLFKKPTSHSKQQGHTEEKMNSLFKKIKSLREQLMETIPRFNEYLMEESVTEARPLKEWRQDAWTLRDTLILYSVHYRSAVQELCELVEQEALEIPVYKVLAGNLRRAGNEFLQKHMFTLQILDTQDNIRDNAKDNSIKAKDDTNRDEPSGFKGKFMKLIPSLFTDDHSDLSFLEFYTTEGDLIPLKDPETIKTALNNQESILKEQLDQLEREYARTRDLSLKHAIEDIKGELEKVNRIK